MKEGTNIIYLSGLGNESTPRKKTKQMKMALF
jgi:hypothetical protein